MCDMPRQAKKKQGLAWFASEPGTILKLGGSC